MMTFKQGVFVAGLLLGGSFTASSFAKNQYRLAAIAQYKLEPDRDDGTRAVNCTFCHVNSTGAAPWNPFGLNLRDIFRKNTDQSANPDLRIRDALYKVLLKKFDSDGDGYSDALEIYAGTLPGNPSSTPTRNLAELEKAFVASGGYAQFKSTEAKP